jgi:hypothetical protein
MVLDHELRSAAEGFADGHRVEVGYTPTAAARTQPHGASCDVDESASLSNARAFAGFS